MPDSKTHHMNTPEGRKAAAEARLRWAAERPDAETPAVFVVRSDGGKPFSWEIRKFGSIVLRRSETKYTAPLLARTAGEKELADMLTDPFL